MPLDPTNGTADRTNGFRIRGFNADFDRLACQSSRQTTFFFKRQRGVARLFKSSWFEVGLAKNEIIVLRPYGAAPEVEIEGLGGPYGVIVVEATRQATRVLRNGQRWRIALQPEESVVIKNETWHEPVRATAQQFAGV